MWRCQKIRGLSFRKIYLKSKRACGFIHQINSFFVVFVFCFLLTVFFHNPIKSSPLILLHNVLKLYSVVFRGRNCNQKRKIVIDRKTNKYFWAKIWIAVCIQSKPAWIKSIRLIESKKCEFLYVVWFDLNAYCSPVDTPSQLL